MRGEVGRRSFALGLLAGIGGGAGLAAFYRALSLGTMSVVSPLVACGAVVPFAISIATGERPSRSRVAGAVAALAGAVLASVEERRADVARPCARRRCSRSSPRSRSASSSTSSASAAARGRRALDALRRADRVARRCWSSLAVGAASAAAPRRGLARRGRGGRRWPTSTANALFAFASGHGLLALVAVLGSLYPVVTVLLAHVLLGERLTRPQQVGIGVALAGRRRDRRG